MTRLQDMPVRFICLMLAILVYAIAGSPTPDFPGWPEGIMAALLVIAAGPGAAFALTNPGMPLVHKIFFVFGMSVPVITGCLHGYDMSSIGRDMAAFLFLCLPLFFLPLIAGHAVRERWLIGCIVILGIVFSLRALGPAYGYMAPAPELYYLTNAPTVLFTAILMVGIMLTATMTRPFVPLLALKALLALLVIMTVLWAMLMDVQRATIGAVIVSALIGLLVAFIRHPRRVIVPLLIIAALLFICLPVFQDALYAMARKTAKVGLNMRLEEVKAVIDTISLSPLQALVGTGWGAKMSSPAVGGVHVAYTHSLLSYMLLKTGLLGLGVTLGWLAVYGWNVVRIARRDLMVGLGLGWGLVIPVLLYASHKSLDFGLILLLIAVLADGCTRRVASAKAPV